MKRYYADIEDETEDGELVCLGLTPDPKGDWVELYEAYADLKEAGLPRAYIDAIRERWLFSCQ